MPSTPLAGAEITVTGGTGFIGSAFVRHAVWSGAHVTVIAREHADHWRLAEVKGRYATLTSSLAGLESEVPLSICDIFVHLAASGVNQSFDDVGALVATNVDGTLHALQYALRCNARRFVHLGSSGEYGSGVLIEESTALNPTSEYGATRASATLLAKTFGQRRGLDVVVARPFAVYGQFESAYRLVPYCILTGLRGEAIRISSGIQTRDYVHVSDVVEGISHVGTLPEATGGTFNLCTGVETSVNDAALRIAQLTAGASDVIAGTRAPVPGEMWRTSGSPVHTADVLGWTATRSFATGIEETIEWFRSEGSRWSQYAAEIP